VIAGGSAHGYWSRIDADPVRVAHARLRCDPDRVGLCWREQTGGDAPGYHMYPLTWINSLPPAITFGPYRAQTTFDFLNNFQLLTFLH
jgi:hypothetical protein